MSKNAYSPTFYTIGLDLGVSSVGWSVIELREEASEKKLLPFRLVDCGVRLFEAAENPKNGESLNVTRRTSRGIRRRLHRRKVRLDSMKKVLKSYSLFSENYTKCNPWIARVEGLDKLLSPSELSSAVLHITKRRGFLSNRRNTSKEEGGKFKEAIEKNSNLLKERECRTIGELIVKHFSRKRNRGDNYDVMVTRQQLHDEMQLILQKQADLGNSNLTTAAIQKILETFSFQLPFASAEDIEKKVGKCSIFPEEKCASLHTLTFQLSTFWQRVNNLRLIDTKAGFQEITLDLKQKQQLLSLLLDGKRDNLKYCDVRKVLALQEGIKFAELRYNYEDAVKKKSDKNPEDKKFVHFSSYHVIRKQVQRVSEEYWKILQSNRQLFDKVATVLTLVKSESELVQKLVELNIPGFVIESLKDVSFRGFGSLSLKALEKLLPYFEQGDVYSTAIEKVGLETIKHSVWQNKLPVIDPNDIRNPVVLRSLTQARKVINAIIDRFGQPTFVHIEVARELKKDHQERRKIEVEQVARAIDNQRLIEKIREDFGLQDPKGIDLVKYRLWKEQHEQSAYSGKRIAPNELFVDNLTQVDHILPYSRSYDDSYTNKVLVFSAENQTKKNKTPYEFLTSSSNFFSWEEFQAWVNSLQVSPKKKQKFLTKELPINPDDVLTRFVQRDLNDTGYITRYFMNFVKQHLLFQEHTGYKRRVFAYQGRVTAQLRARWGLNKLKQRHENVRHHALDAVVCGLASLSFLQKVSHYYQHVETHSYDKVQYPTPWDGFYTDIATRVFGDDLTDIIAHHTLPQLYADMTPQLRTVFVSRKVNHKVTGPAHAATLLSPKYLEQGFATKRTSITDINSKNFDKIIADDVVKEVLKKRLEEHDWKAEKAFVQPIYKPSKKGNPNRITKVKMKEVRNSWVFLNNGKAVAKQEEMVRVDVFSKEKKYYLVPIYVSDTLKEDIPNKAIVAKKQRDKWLEMDSSYLFEFSLFKKDLIQISDKDKDYIGYYVKTHSGSGDIYFVLHDAPKVDKTTCKPKGARNLKLIKKLQVDYLGYISPAPKESRRGFKASSHPA